ncbi:MAG: CdaR family protein [Anaerolineae bacterium]
MGRWIDSVSSLLLALFLALMVWLLTGDTQRPMVTSPVPASGGLSLTYEHVPDGFMPLSDDDGKVKAIVRGFKDAVGPQTASDLVLVVDLAHLSAAQARDAVETPVSVPVRWRWRDDVGWSVRRREALRVLTTDPSTVAVRLDPIVTSTLRVEVELANKAEGGIDLGERETDPATVRVTGPRTVLTRITRAVALVDSAVLAGSTAPRLSGLPLVAMDASGTVIDRVTLDPDRVTVTVDPTSFGYRLPVVVEPRGNVPAGYDWRGLTYDPKEVHVFGPRDGIKQLLAAGKVSARPIDLGPITQTTRLQSPLLLPAGVEAVGLPTGGITVTVQVDVLRGSQQYTVPVEAEGVPPGLRAVISPATVIVVLRGDRPVLDQLSASDLKAVVIARRLAAGVHRMPVNLRLPPGLERVSVAPDPIELTLEGLATARPGR